MMESIKKMLYSFFVRCKSNDINFKEQCNQKSANYVHNNRIKSCRTFELW